MSEAILLRTMTGRSILNFGQYSGYTVDYIINIGKLHYLRWLYYNIEGISFVPEILRKINIISDTFDNSIVKPGKAPEMYTDKKLFKKSRAYISTHKSILRELINEDKKKFSRSRLRRMNHGHRMS